MFRAKIKTTFSFGKLKRSVPKIMRESVDNIGELAEKVMKNNIDTARYPKLSPFTLKMRKKGVGWGGKKVSPTNNKTPLRQTDSLYNSLKYNKSDQTIKMNAYGKMHHKGFTNKSGFNIPARPFMDMRSGEKGFFFNKPDKMLPAAKAVAEPITENFITKKLQKAWRIKGSWN